MHKKSIAMNVNGNSVQRILSLLLVLTTLIGCSSNMVTAGKDGISIEAGEWIGQSDDGSFSMEFKIGTNGENIFITLFSYPCGEQNAYVFPPSPIKTGLNNSTFETTTTDFSDLLPKLVITGKFVDSTHIEGTWDFSGFQEFYLDQGCPPVIGTWKGGPK